MFTKRLIQLLSLCLVAVIGLFLYSEYSVNQTVISSDIPSSDNKPSQVVSEPTAASNEIANEDQASAIEQPDKSIPIPAHKIKKILDDPEQVEDPELQQKIESANQAIAELDKKLNNVSEANVEQNEVKADEDLQKRIDHIKDHLEKISEE